MSIYQFFSSNKPLEEYDNERIVLDEKRQILKGKNGGITTFDEKSALRIIIEDDVKQMRLYTEKKYGAYVEWEYTDKNAEIIIQYIERHLKQSKEIELWNVWMGPKERKYIKKCPFKDLEISDIKDIWGKEYFDHPECLAVYQK